VRLMKIGFLVAFAAAAGWAQVTAQIHGTVQDTSGAVIAGATVKATQTETGISRTVTSEADGSYVIPDLPLGRYQVEVSKEGFTTLVQTGIVLQVGSNPTVPIALKVGAVTERVTVEANATQVETATVAVGSVVENQRVVDLPLNGRNPTDLIVLSGAAVATSSGSTSSMRGGYAISVAGGIPIGVEYKLDGATHNDFLNGIGQPLPFPDALQEFKLSTSAQDPSNSGRAGAAVNAVMKSGTNAFHGSLFEFLRNYDANGRDFFATGPDGLKRNQFGGTLGGPIQKNKLFFFVGYQGTTVRQTPIANIAIVPTPDMLQGNFAPYQAQCNGNKRLGAPFVNNQVDRSQLSPAAVNIARLLPKPSDACGVVQYAIPLHENDHEGDARVDYQLSEKHSLFFRNMLVKQNVATPFSLNPTNVLAASGNGADNQFEGFALGHTYLISASKVNAVRLFLERSSTLSPAIKMFGPKDVGINMYTDTPNYMAVNTTGAFILGNAYLSESGFAHNTAFGANEDFRIVHGSHQFAFGGFLTRAIVWSNPPAFASGPFFMTGQATGLGLADFLLGRASLFKQANFGPVNVSQNFINLFAQDTWKITRNLTMTYGVNWNPFLGMTFQQGDLYSFSLANYYAGTTSKVVQGAPPGFSFPGDPGFLGKSGVKSRYGHVDPRLGLAWDPFGDAKTAIRIGAGIAHDFNSANIDLNTSSSLPFRLTVQNAGVRLDDPYPQGDPFPYNYNPKNPVWPTAATAPCLLTTCPPSFLPIPPDINTQEQYSWNFGVQRQITQNWFLSATYLGTHIVHIWNQVELNPAVYVSGNCGVGQYGLTAAGPCTQPGNITQRRVLNLARPTAPPLAYLTQVDDGATQGYNGLLVSTNYRFGTGLSVNGNYTWSHCIGMSEPNVEPTGNNYITQGYGQNVYPVNRRPSMGNCVADRRQLANISLVFQTPKFSNRAARILASGWTLASILQARTGSPLTVVTNVNPDPATGFGAITSGTQRPNQILENVNSPAQGASCPPTGGAFCVQWLNPAAFSIPTVGTAGNMAANTVFGPGFWQWDQQLTRAFQIREGQRLEVRIEAFNVTNSLHPGNPQLTVGSPTFGLITTDMMPPTGVSNPAGGTFNGPTSIAGQPTNAPARVMQFVLKYVF
jgi:hypothetical protein